MTFTELAEKLHNADRLSIAPGGSNLGINPALKGAYITIQKGLLSITVFVGVKDGRDVIELVA